MPSRFGEASFTRLAPVTNADLASWDSVDYVLRRFIATNVKTWKYGGWVPKIGPARMEIVPSVFGRGHCGEYAYGAPGEITGYEGRSGGPRTNEVPGARVVGYGFRGDGRDPDAIREAGGFWPPITKPGYRVDPVLDKAPLSLTAHSYLNNRASGFVSFTRDARSAFLFGNWVYVALLEGAVDINRPRNNTLRSEAEVSLPGGVDWDDVVAYRKASRDTSEYCPVFMRDGFVGIDPAASRVIHFALSLEAKRQPIP